jgi:hypothetical protein
MRDLLIIFSVLSIQLNNNKLCLLKQCSPKGGYLSKNNLN